MNSYHVQRLDFAITYAFFSAVRTEALPNKEHSQIATWTNRAQGRQIYLCEGDEQLPQLIPNLVAHQDRQEFLPKGLARAILCHWPTISDVWNSKLVMLLCFVPLPNKEAEYSLPCCLVGCLNFFLRIFLDLLFGYWGRGPGYFEFV